MMNLIVAVSVAIGIVFGGVCMSIAARWDAKDWEKQKEKAYQEGLSNGMNWKNFQMAKAEEEIKALKADVEELEERVYLRDSQI